jgi:hypothetical protein
MPQDILGKIAEARETHRETVRKLSPSFGITVPKTEREWLLFDLNQNLRLQGVGKATYMAPADA